MDGWEGRGEVRSGEGGQDLLGPLCRFLGGERGGEEGRHVWDGGCGMGL